MASLDSYSLFFVVDGCSEESDILHVEIPKNITIFRLKEVIVEQAKLNTDIQDINLYKVEVSVDENFAQNLKDAAQTLIRPTSSVENTFLERPKLDTVHIIVKYRKLIPLLFLSMDVATDVTQVMVSSIPRLQCTDHMSFVLVI